MRSVTFLGFFGLLALPAAAQTPVAPGDSAAYVRHARATAEAFVRYWRYSWEVSEQYRHITGAQYADAPRMTWDPPSGVPPILLPVEEASAVQGDWIATVLPPGKPWTGIDTLRTDLLHCHTKRDAHQTFPQQVIESPVGGAGRKRAICPSWFTQGMRPPWDERTFFDGAISELLQDSVVEHRARLLTEFTGVASIVPGDGWIAGQTVRFALDQNDTAMAQRAADRCGGTLWWCTALQGYLAYITGDASRADRVFSAMLAVMPAAERCAWTDLSPLLDAAGRRAYALVPCASRDTLNDRVWWLSDPLYTEPGNERRAEDFARRVLIALRIGTMWNERWDLRDAGGGAAIKEMIQRYGWPSFSFWGGKGEDLDHFAYFNIVSIRRGDHDDTLQAHGRFATAEYSTPRYHTVPSWETITHPTRALASDWVLSARAALSLDPMDTLWWPTEHFARAAGPLVELWNQTGLFRRRDSTLLVVATDLWPADFPGVEHDSLTGALVLSAGPNDPPRLEPALGVIGATTVIHSMLGSRPQVASLELHESGSPGVAARTRFGVEPPPPLAAMRSDEIAISAPIFFRPPPVDELARIDAEAAMARMYGNTVFTFALPGRNLGIYWETYGVGEGDTVDIAIRVERRQARTGGVLRRLGVRLGIGQAPSSAVAFGWREPDPGRQVSTIAGPVPIQGRNVSLDVSQLAPGDYTLTVSVNRPGGETFTGARDFRIVVQ